MLIKFNKTSNKSGFTLIELMIVVAIVGFLSMISIPSLMSMLAKAKRTEAYVNLGSLAMAQKAFFAENGTYSTDLAGDLGWKPGGDHKYSYGFGSGTAGKHYFTGSLNAPASDLSGAVVSGDGFTAYAAGDIDGDGKSDIISIDQDNKIKIVQDDLT